MGLAENGGKVDPAKADEPFNDPFVVKTANEAARKSVMLKDSASLLPIDAEEKILLIEQIFPTHAFAANMYSHPGLLWDEMCKIGSDVSSVEIPYFPSGNDLDRVRMRIGEANTIVMTNYYYHKGASSISNVVREIMDMGKKVIVVTNTPYEFGLPDDFPTGIICFNPGSREHMRAVAEVIYGKLKPTAGLSFDVNADSLTENRSSQD